jgi:hypothetical protein
MSDDNKDLIPEDDQGLIADFMLFIKEEKIWWIVPLLLLLGLLVLLILAGEGSGILAPFIYPFA